MTMNLDVILLLISAISASISACPDECQCKDTKILCQGRIITQFPSGISPNTTVIYISTTNISSLKPSDLENVAGSLKFFGIKDTHIQTIFPKTFDQTTNLTNLIFRDTQLVELPEDLFHSLASLQLLNLNGNRLQSLPPSFLSPLTQLRNLDLSKNQLSSLQDNTFSGLNLLQVLELNGNSLRELPSGLFYDLENLEKLTLQDNHITELSPNAFSKLQKLKSLFLSNNRLSLLPEGIFSRLCNLTKLTLHDNDLQQLSHGTFGPMYVEDLWLYGNKIGALEDGVFSNLTHLKLLVLSRNDISDISIGAFRGLTELREVSLHTNRITHIKKGTFSGLPKLENISLEHNEIKFISKDILHGVSHLNQLDLRNNSLQHLDQDFLDSLQAVDEVLLTLNPWVCGEEIIPFRNWLQQHPHKVPSMADIVCLEPPSLMGTVIRDILDNDIYQPMTQVPTADRAMTPTEKMRRPHTHSSRETTPFPAINVTTQPTGGEDTSSGQGDNTRPLKEGHLFAIIAVVSTTLIVGTIFTVACYRRNQRRGSRNLDHQQKSSSVI